MGSVRWVQIGYVTSQMQGNQSNVHSENKRALYQSLLSALPFCSSLQIVIQVVLLSAMIVVDIMTITETK